MIHYRTVDVQLSFLMEQETARKELAYVRKGIFGAVCRTTQTPVLRDKPKIGRNDPCPCGSGKKFKQCCLGKGTYD